jgi:hypothetical protein
MADQRAAEVAEREKTARLKNGAKAGKQSVPMQSRAPQPEELIQIKGPRKILRRGELIPCVVPARGGGHVGRC